MPSIGKCEVAEETGVVSWTSDEVAHEDTAQLRETQRLLYEILVTPVRLFFDSTSESTDEVSRVPGNTE